MIDRYTRDEMKEIWSIEKKFALMLEVELLTAEAQAVVKKMFPVEAVKEMRSRARFDVEEILRIEQETHHDVVAFVKNVSETLGEYAQYFHKGLTSNDLLDTSLALQLKAACQIILGQMDRLIELVGRKAIEYKNSLCIGRTHGVHAEPTTLGLKFLLFWDELKRGRSMLQLTIPIACCGKLSGAVGNFAHNDIDVETYVCDKLGIKPALVSTQVVPRDRLAYLVSAFAAIGGTLERFATEIRHLQRTEVREMSEPFSKGQKGSSAMPHKKNPILCERITGQARLLRSYAVSAFENIALWHERDISHSSVERVILPDATILLDYMLDKMCYIVEHLVVDEMRAYNNIGITYGLVFSQAVLNKLMEKGLARMDAYEIVQRNALAAWQTERDFMSLLKADEDVKKHLTDDELDACFSMQQFLRNIDNIFRRTGVEGD